MTLSLLTHFYCICLITVMVFTSLLFFSKVKTENQSLEQVRWKISMIQIMARPFLKTSGFACTVIFLSPVFDGRYLNARSVNLS